MELLNMEDKKNYSNLISNISTFADQVGTDIKSIKDEIRIMQPTDISLSVANILSSGDTVSKMYKEQLEFDSAQKLSNLKIAVEKGIYYLEDCLEESLRQKVLSGYFKDNKASEEESYNVSKSITDFFVKVPDHSFITARRESYFPVTKNKGYMPEVFGAENRKIKKGGYVTLTVNGAQPCIYIENKIGLHIDFSGVHFIAEDMGINVFEVCKSKHWNIIHGGHIKTRRYMEVGYTGGYQGLFPPIDGWTPELPEAGTGYADKGYYTMGFNTSDFSHDISAYRNNQADASVIGDMTPLVKQVCSKKNVEQWARDKSARRPWGCGGYWTEDGLGHAFPQDDGTTSPTWGTWGGAQHGSHGSAWHIYGCDNFTFNYFDVQGMNGNAIVMGLYGKRDGTSVNAGDSHIAIENHMVCNNIKILGGYIHGNYVGGVGIVRGENILVSGLFCPDGRVGHPDANVGHSRNDGGITIDPGYWIWTSRYLPQNNIRYENNHLGLAARKVCDAHTGNNINIINNTGSALFYACGLVIQEAYAAIGGGGDGNKNKAEATSFLLHESNINIIGNTFVSGCIGLHLNNGATGVKSRKDQGLWWLRGNVRVLNNNIIANRGLVYNYGHGGFNIEGNSVTFGMPFGEPFGMRGLNDVELTSSGSGYSQDTYIEVTGGGPKARGFILRPRIINGKIVNIYMDSGGTCIDDPDSIRINFIDPKGTGSGAAARHTGVGNVTFAYFFGADGKYGKITDSTFSNNRARNSPYGNFLRMLWSGEMEAVTIRDNRFDITPYMYADAKNAPNTPYRSELPYVNRAGQRVQILNQAATVVDCHIDNNKAYNLITGQVDDIVFREKFTASGTKEEIRPVRASELSDYLRKEDLLNMLKDFNITGEIKKEETKDNEEVTPAPTEPQVSEAELERLRKEAIAIEENSIIEWTSFVGAEYPNNIPANKEAYIKWFNNREFPDGWNNYVKVQEGISFLETHSEKGRNDGTMMTTQNVNLLEEAVGNITIVMPFRALDFNRANILWILGGLRGEFETREGVNPSAIAFKSQVGGEYVDGKFSFTRTNVNINGVDTKPTDQFDIGKWYVLTITGAWVGNGTVHGGQANGNGMHSIQIGEGLRFYRNGKPSQEHLNEYVQSLVAKYEKLNEANAKEQAV